MRFIKLLILFICFYVSGYSQAMLPAIAISSENAINTISWYCQYDGVKSISVQRSADSVRNFTTINTFSLPKKGNQLYRDMHPMVGKNYYRLSIEFGGDLEWFSNRSMASVDSATIAKAMADKARAEAERAEAARLAAEKAEALRAEAAAAKAKKGIPVTPITTTVEKVESTKPEEFYFTPSSKIFTNPYTGHININLEDAYSHHYNIKFYDPSKNEVLRISRVSKSVLILDKSNFNSRGIYSFKLFDGSELIESGFVNIY